MGAKIYQFAHGAIVGRIAGRSSASDVQVRVAGLSELLDGLMGLPAELGKKAIYASLGAAARVVRDAAIAGAPVLDASDPAVLAGRRKPGTLKRAIRASRSKLHRGQNGYYEMIVRVRPLKSAARAKFRAATGKAGAANPDDPYYWWWVEFGTSKMGARPFLRPAFESTKDLQLQRMRTRMRSALDVAARRIAAEVRNAA